ncbi:hypothetical protein MKW92_004553, partial [Papaver armeniacum]
MACEDALDRCLLHESLFGYMSEEEEEEEEGLPIPTMEDEDFLSSIMNNNVNTDLENFFDKEDVFDEKTKPTGYYDNKEQTENYNTGKGKQLKVLKESLIPGDHEEEKKILSPNFDEQHKFWNEKLEISKRKLRDGYEKIAN